MRYEGYFETNNLNPTIACLGFLPENREQIYDECNLDELAKFFRLRAKINVDRWYNLSKYGNDTLAYTINNIYQEVFISNKLDDFVDFTLGDISIKKLLDAVNKTFSIIKRDGLDSYIKNVPSLESLRGMITAFSLLKLTIAYLDNKSGIA